jgi:outer membrane protein OmpA-like peptidoglycan-associated protein
MIDTIRFRCGFQTTKVEVGGHTSHEGTKSFNRKLGRLRAKAGRDLLVGKGVPPERVVVKSYGPDMPAAPHDGGEGSAACWRVTVRVID